jgi:hypothetical protein
VLRLQFTSAVAITTLTIEKTVLADIHAVCIAPETLGATLILQHGVYLLAVMKI